MTIQYRNVKHGVNASVSKDDPRAQRILRDINQHGQIIDEDDFGHSDDAADIQEGAEDFSGKELFLEGMKETPQSVILEFRTI